MNADAREINLTPFQVREAQRMVVCVMRWGSDMPHTVRAECDARFQKSAPGIDIQTQADSVQLDDDRRVLGKIDIVRQRTRADCCRAFGGSKIDANPSVERCIRPDVNLKSAFC